MTSLRFVEGHKRDGSTVQVTVGRAANGRTVVAIGDTVVELDANNTVGLIVAAGEMLHMGRFQDAGT